MKQQLKDNFCFKEHAVQHLDNIQSEQMCKREVKV